MNNMESEEDSMEHWKTRALQLEKVIKTLSNHCVRVVEKHEELLDKFQKNQEQYVKLQSKFQEKGDQIKKAREVLIPVSTELRTLREKYEIAVRCQMEAESYAVKKEKKYKVLKRQSQMFGAKFGAMSTLEINIEGTEDEDDAEKEYIAKLDQQIDELEEQKSALAVEVKEIMENFDIEKETNGLLRAKIEQMKEELKQSKETIKQQEDLLQQVANTSEKAYKEYVDMEQTYRKEKVVRSKAERVAQKLFTEREQARRESTLALSKVSDNRKLMDALLEIQELNCKAAQVKEEYDEKISLLEEQLNAVKEVYTADGLEADNEELLEERNSLQEKLEKSEAEIKQMQGKYDVLMATYKTLEEKYESATSAPPPPPPPPPPPLPPPALKSAGFLQRIVGRKGQRERAKEKLKKGGVSTNDNHTKAVDEMMNRIKSGNIGLKPVLKKQTHSLPEEEDQSAMTELQGLLTKMKKARSEDDLLTFGETGVDEKSELGKILKKRQQAIKDPPSSESANSNGRPVPRPRKLSVIADEEM